MPMTTRARKRVSIKGVSWKRATSMPAEKYEQVSKAILSVLSSEPMKFTQLAQLVEQRLPGFDGSVPWYTISVARELEAQGKLVRRSKPVLYSTPNTPARKATRAKPGSAKATASSRRAKRAA